MKLYVIHASLFVLLIFLLSIFYYPGFLKHSISTLSIRTINKRIQKAYFKTLDSHRIENFESKSLIHQIQNNPNSKQNLTVNESIPSVNSTPIFKFENFTFPVQTNITRYKMLNINSHFVYNHQETLFSNGTESSFSLNTTEQSIIKEIYEDVRRNISFRQPIKKNDKEKKYLLVYATVVLFDDDPTRRELQHSCLDSMIYLQKYYPIKYVIFEQNNATIRYLKKLGFDVCSHYEQNEYGMATMRGLFKYIEQHYNSVFYGYINGDIFQSSYLYDLLYQLNERMKTKQISSELFLVGRRHDFYFNEFSKIEKHVKEYDVLSKYGYITGSLHTIWGMDYFISTKGLITKKDIDAIVIGRLIIDNYLLAYVNAKSDYFTSIDVSDYLITVHISNRNKHKTLQAVEDKLYNKFLLRKHKRWSMTFAQTTSAHYKAYMGENCTLIIENMKLNDTAIIKRNRKLLKEII